MARDTGSAKLPALPSVATGNVSLDRLLQAVCERLEVREGSRGNPYERALLVRDVAALGFDPSLLAGARGASQAGTAAQAPRFDGMSADAFSEAIRNSKIYQDLKRSLDDPARFGDLPDKVQALLTSVAQEATKRGADVRQLEMALQTLGDSLAYRLTEVTAAVESAQAGVRQISFASTTPDNATAGLINQIQARLDNVGGVTLEQSLLATADRVDGLAGEYMVKINAGGAVAGIGLAASEDLNGLTNSAFIVQADKFAVTMPGLSQSVPFGVDASGVFINGALRINAGGTTLQDAASGTDGKSTYAAPVFQRSATVLSVAPTGGTFNFGTNVLTPPANWFASPPGGSNPMYVSTTTFSISGDTGTASAGTWSAPVLFVQDGLPGSSGSSTYAYPIYRRSATAPATPTGGQYDFGTNTGTPPAAWSNSIPAGADRLYISTAIASAPGAAGVASVLTWSAPVILAQNGTDSTVPGPTGSRGTITTFITDSFSASAAATKINAIASAAGMTPTNPIRGDIVSHPAGAQECTTGGSPGSWAPVAAYINGNLLVSGTVSAGVSFSSAGFFSGTGEAAGGLANVAPDGSAVSVTYTGMFISTSGTGARAGVIGKVSTSGGGAGVYGESPVGNSAAAGVVGSGFYGVVGKGIGGANSVGVYGAPQRTNIFSGLVEGVGVQGVGGTSPTSIGVLAQAGSAGLALRVAGASTFTGAIQCDSNINVVGNVTAFGSSDMRLKENIAVISNALQKVRAMRGVHFTWTDSYIQANGGEDGYFLRKHDVGVVAQEVREVFPEIVGERPDGMLAVRYDRLVPVLLEAIKELEARLARLEAP